MNAGAGTRERKPLYRHELICINFSETVRQGLYYGVLIGMIFTRYKIFYPFGSSWDLNFNFKMKTYPVPAERCLHKKTNGAEKQTKKLAKKLFWVRPLVKQDIIRYKNYLILFDGHKVGSEVDILAGDTDFFPNVFPVELNGFV